MAWLVLPHHQDNLHRMWVHQTSRRSWLWSPWICHVLEPRPLLHLRHHRLWTYFLISEVLMFVTLGLFLRINMFRLSTIYFRWQLLILRGHLWPMSFAMAHEYTGPFKLFEETTLLVIVFSVMVVQHKLRTEGRPSAVMTSIYSGGELCNSMEHQQDLLHSCV